MIITLKKNLTKQEEKKVVSKVKELGYIPHIVKGKNMTIIGMVGEFAEKYSELFKSMEEVDHISEIEKPYKLASRDFKQEDNNKTSLRCRNRWDKNSRYSRTMCNRK